MKPFLFFLFGCVLSFTMAAQDGMPDNSFGDDGVVKTDLSSGGRDFAYAIAQMQDGKLLVGGGMDDGNFNSFPAIVQYNADGSLSLSFGGDGIVSRDIGGDFGYYKHVGAQADGKVVAAGSVGSFGNRIIIVNRYLPSGGLDTSFGTNGDLIPFNSTNESSAFVMLDNDSFLMANPVIDGNSTVIQLKKYLPNGTLDSSFGDNGTTPVENGSQSNAIYAMEVMANGNIVIAARVQTGGSYLDSLVRLLPDGSKDTSFGTNGTTLITEFIDYDLRAIAVYDNGQIAVLQNSYIENTKTNLTRITRFRANGVLDNTFGTGGQGFIDPNKQVLAANSLIIQPNQRLLLYGVFENPLEGGGYTFIKRYHTNGGTDDNFNFIAITEFEYFAAKIILQDDGKLVCIGTTAWYNGPEDFVLERYHNTPLSVPDFESGSLVAFPNPTQNTVTITYDLIKKAEVSYQISDVSGKILAEGKLSGNQTVVDLSSLQSGLYFLNAANTSIRLLKE